MSSKNGEAVEGFSLAKVKKERPDSDEEGAGDEDSMGPFQTVAKGSSNSGTQSSTPQNGATGMRLVTIKKESPESPVAGTSSSSSGGIFPVGLDSIKQEQEINPVTLGAIKQESGIDPVTMGAVNREPGVDPLTLGAIKQEPGIYPVSLSSIKREEPEGSVGSGDPPSSCKGGKRVAPALPNRQRIGNTTDCFYDPILGFVKEGDQFNLDLSLSLEDAESLNFQFDELTSFLNSTPGFDDNSLFDVMRKDPLAAFNLPNVTVEKVLQLLETDVASGRLEHIKSNWRRVSIGTYHVRKSSADPTIPTEYIVSKYGFSLSIRHTNIISRHQVKVCIPITDIMDFRIHNGPKICLMGIQTGSAYAAWLRSALGMEYDPKSLEFRKLKRLPSPFYGPLLGGEEHKWIILMVETLSEEDYSKVKTFFLHSNGKDFVCRFVVMTNIEAREFVVAPNIYY